VASCLKTSHHELIFLGDGLHDTILFLRSSDLVTDFVKVKLHVGEPLTLLSVRAVDRPVDEFMGIGVRVMASMDSQSLLDVEADTVSSDLTV